MIPSFPVFKKLELSDRKEIEDFTKSFLPYSDFNFTSLWSWNTKDEIKISCLENNLVVQFTDYITKQRFYSFLGKQKVLETLDQLSSHIDNEKSDRFLSLIPHEIAEDMTRLNSNHSVVEDRDQFDYVYSTQELKNLVGNRFMVKRNQINQFTKKHPEIVVREIDVTNEKNHIEINKINTVWLENKIKDSKDVDAENELLAINRFFESVKFNDNPEKIVSIGVYSNDSLIGYFLGEIINSDYGVCHFIKCDNSYKGVYSYLMREVGRFFDGKTTFINFEQDLGIPGLRQSKTLFRPIHFLKKYKILLA